MALSWDDWKRPQGWDVFAPNDWNFIHKLKFEGTATAGTLQNMTRGGAVEGDTCVWSLNGTEDEVSVRCIRDGKTYTIIRTVGGDGKSRLNCERSGGSSWTAEEGG